jgi:hypothetical protein
VRRRSDCPYDAAAATCDRHRKLPEGVAQAIRGAVLRALDPSACVTGPRSVSINEDWYKFMLRSLILNDAGRNRGILLGTKGWKP